jgi:hypothetical protein
MGLRKERQIQKYNSLSRKTGFAKASAQDELRNEKK